MKKPARIWVCHNDQLSEGRYIRVAVEYMKELSSVILFRYGGKWLAYRNLCVHMPRTLDCEEDMIFDESGQKLRCSMHGIIYDPLSGESESTICNGERLTPVKVIEDEEGVWIYDKRVKPLSAGLDSTL